MNYSPHERRIPDGELHALLVMIDKARFRRAVVPGDRMELHAKLVHVNGDGARAEATAWVDGEVVTTAELTFAFAPVTSTALLARRHEVLNIWLHGSITAAITTDP